MDEGRSKNFQRNNELMQVLDEINSGLVDFPAPDVDRFSYPPVFIVGGARSGTTLFFQWLSATGLFGYPSNIIARFYGKPYFGVRAQQALFDFDDKKQIIPEAGKTNFVSSLGHTTGGLSPSEFWYFWRRFFHFGDIQQLSPEEFHQSDTAGFIRELQQMEMAFEKQLLMKAMIVNWNLQEYFSLFERCLIIHIERDDRFVAQSLYHSRLRYFDSIDKWWSFKPPEYYQLRSLSPLEQVAGQAFFTRKAITQQLANLPVDSVLTVAYENFCEDPASILQLINQKLVGLGYTLPDTGNDTTTFNINREITLKQEQFKVIEQSLQQFSSEGV